MISYGAMGALRCRSRTVFFPSDRGWASHRHAQVTGGEVEPIRAKISSRRARLVAGTVCNGLVWYEHVACLPTRVSSLGRHDSGIQDLGAGICKETVMTDDTFVRDGGISTTRSNVILPKQWQIGSLTTQAIS